MNVLVSYDLENNRLRTRFANQLLALGLIRVQLSVFVGALGPPYLSKLERSILDVTQAKEWQEEDAVLLLPLHDYSRERLKSWGKLPDNWDLINDPPHTLIL